MNPYKKLTLLVCYMLAICANISCERDDICAEDTATTPFLIIKFIDDNTVSDIKQPNELQVKAIGFDSIISFETNQDSIMIPLRTNEMLTSFEFTIDSDTMDGTDTVLPNTDILNFEYTPVDEYVSSACGFRVIYNDLELTDIDSQPTDDDEWIQRITIVEENVINETAAHILIFH